MKRTERSWMYDRVEGRQLKATFIKGLDDFVEFAKQHQMVKDFDKIRCPCLKCNNICFLDEKGAQRLKDMTYWVVNKKKRDRPIWVPEPVFKELLDRENVDDIFKKRSAQAKKNKRGGGNNKLVNPGHCQGSISTVEVAERMAVEQGVTPSAAEVYLRKHSRKVATNDTMICCDKSIAILDNYDKMVDDCKQKGITKDLNEIYFDVVGGRKKGLVPGLGSASNLYYKKSSNRGHKSSSNFTLSLVSQLSSQIQQSQDKMCERIAELENRHEKQQAEFESRHEKQQALLEEQRREFEKERAEMQKERDRERKMFGDAIDPIKKQVIEYGKCQNCKDLSPHQPDRRDLSSGGAPCNI